MALASIVDLLRLPRLTFRSRARLAAKNLFRRKQLACYVERKVRPKISGEHTIGEEEGEPLAESETRFEIADTTKELTAEGQDAIRPLSTAVLALLIAPALASAQGSPCTHEDRIAVEDVMARYVWAVDSLDAEGYVAVLTDDAVIARTGASARGTRRFERLSQVSCNGATTTRPRACQRQICTT